MTNTHDPVLDALAGLGARSPKHLLDRLYVNWTTVPGSVGDVHVAFTDRGVSFVRPADEVLDSAEFVETCRTRFGRPLRHVSAPPPGLARALTGRSAARACRVDLDGLTGFEQEVLAVVRRIPAGQVRPYSWVAHEIGKPTAVRAVGTALGRNPVPLLIPCHRVVRADGEPGDYIFGQAAKERLLRAEHVDVDEVRALAQTNVFFIGSDTTHIVCFPTCAHARRITTPHRRGFRSIAAAARAGYRPCLACRPVPVASAS